MDPVTILMGATALAGIATSLFGSQEASDVSGKIAQTNVQIAGVEKAENYQRYLAMLYTSRRQNIENLRRVQQSRAAIETAGVGAGAQYGSSVAAGRGGAVAEGAFNTQGMRLGVQTGTEMYGLSNQISDLQAQRATYEGQLASAQGTMQLGAGITQASPFVGKFGGGAIQAASQPNFFNSGWGMPTA